MSSEQSKYYLSEEPDLPNLGQVGEIEELDFGDFFAAEFGEDVAPTVLFDAKESSSDQIAELVAQGVQVEVVENLEVFETVSELQADLQQKIQKNRALTDVLGAVGSIFGGCGGLLHFHGTQGMSGSSSLFNTGENGSNNTKGIDSRQFPSGLSNAWSQSNGDHSLFIEILSRMFPNIRLFIENSVGIQSLLQFGPKNSVCVDDVIQSLAG